MAGNIDPEIVRLSDEEAGLLGLNPEWLGEAEAAIGYLDKGESLKPATMTISLTGAETTTASVSNALIRKAIASEKRLRRGVLLLIPESDTSTAKRFEELGLMATNAIHRLGERALNHTVLASDIGRLRAALAEI